MHNTTQLKPYLIALGTALGLSLAIQAQAASANPFTATDLGNGYMVSPLTVADAGNMGMPKTKDGQCSANKKMADPMPKAKDGQCSANKKMSDAMPKTKDGQCSANKKMADPKPKAKDGQCASSM